MKIEGWSTCSHRNKDGAHAIFEDDRDEFWLDGVRVLLWKRNDQYWVIAATPRDDDRLGDRGPFETEEAALVYIALMPRYATTD